LEAEKKYPDSDRCQCCDRQQFVSSSQRNTLGLVVLGFNGNLQLVLHRVELRADLLEIDLLRIVKVLDLYQDPLTRVSSEQTRDKHEGVPPAPL
jgi:hypothetical protein